MRHGRHVRLLGNRGHLGSIKVTRHRLIEHLALHPVGATGILQRHRIHIFSDPLRGDRVLRTVLRIRVCIDGRSGTGTRAAAKKRTSKVRVLGGRLKLRSRKCKHSHIPVTLPWALICAQETTTGVASTILLVLPSNVFARPRLPNAYSLFGPSALLLLSPLFFLGTGQIATTT